MPSFIHNSQGWKQPKCQLAMIRISTQWNLLDSTKSELLNTMDEPQKHEPDTKD